MSQHLSEVTVAVGERPDQYVTLSVTILDSIKSITFGERGELRFVPNKQRGADVLMWREGPATKRGRRRFVYDKEMRVLCRRAGEVFWS